MDNVLTLITETVTGYDEYGNKIITKSEREVFCRTYDVNRNEFYSAATVGLKPDLTVRVFHDEYQGEQKARFEGKEYNVIRTYRGDNLELDDLEIVLERTIANG